ncbi:hypothetical protein JTB14_024462 [Gonioctena quinquepunctata]|nr:hypothetical protein JTB14_024462 [Gonioctena quinquepunctata]
MAGPSRTFRFFVADFETTVQKWLDEADSDADDIRKDEDELVSEHDSRSEQSADSDCYENPEDDVAELCDRDYDVAENECAGNNVAETDSEQFGLRNIPLSEKENNNSPNSGTDDDADDIPLSELLARLNSKKNITMEKKDVSNGPRYLHQREFGMLHIILLFLKKDCEVVPYSWVTILIT